MKVIGNQVQKFGKLFPNIHPFYAVKANDDENILRYLALQGVNFDCASRHELKKMQRILKSMDSSSSSSCVNESSKEILEKSFRSLGDTNDRIPSRCIFAHPFKKIQDMRVAMRLGVSMMTFDSVDELKKCVGLMEDFSDKENIDCDPVQCVIRLDVDCSGSITRLSDKFGASVETSKDIIDFAKSHRKYVSVVGIAFHVGSGCSNPKLYKSALKLAKEVFSYGLSQGFSMDILDIGGGLPGSLSLSGDCLLEQISECVKSSLLEIFCVDLEKGDMKGMTVIAEPGRFFVSASHILVAPVIAKKEKQGLVNYVITEGLYSSLNNIIFDGFKIRYGENFDILQKREKKDIKEKLLFRKAIIWGPTCDSLDKIGECHIPELQIGDLILFYEQGAYTCCATSRFNGMPLCQKVFV